jgi:hypothetical protein
MTNGAEHPRKQQRSDLNVPLENNNVLEVNCLCLQSKLIATDDIMWNT